RNGDLEQALLAVGDLACLPFRDLFEAERGEMACDLVGHRGITAEPGKDARGLALPLEHREGDMLLRCHVREETRHLEGPHQASTDPAHGPKPRHVLLPKQDAARIGAYLTGDEIDESGLAG